MGELSSCLWSSQDPWLLLKGEGGHKNSLRGPIDWCCSSCFAISLQSNPRLSYLCLRNPTYKNCQVWDLFMYLKLVQDARLVEGDDKHGMVSGQWTESNVSRSWTLVRTTTLLVKATCSQPCGWGNFNKKTTTPVITTSPTWRLH